MFFKVSSVIGLMCATRYGLLDSELVELLSSDLSVTGMLLIM